MRRSASRIAVVVVGSLLLLCAVPGGAAEPPLRAAAFEMNARLGRGINLGDMFEAPSEGSWGNPYRPEYFRAIADLGFNHVRIPIRWETPERSMAGPPYTIEPSFIARIRSVVQTALDSGLIVIIDMHHHDALYAHPAAERSRFLSQWRQIATAFRDFPPEVLFEVLNEPHDRLTPELWNRYFADALAEIRRTNPTRVVLMGTAEWGGLAALPRLSIPDDEYLILTVHYYNPFSFTHQGAGWVGEESEAWVGTRWQDTEFERQDIETEFRVAQWISSSRSIPIHVGEFGSYERADMESRVRWTRFLARWFEEQGWSWAYWEFSAGFGIYDPERRTLREPLVNALLHDPMPAPRRQASRTIYESDFSRSGDGWTAWNQDGAASRLSARNGSLVLAVDRLGSEGWHVQLVKPSIPLVRGRTYRVTFTASATEMREASVYVGRAGAPWDSYSAYRTVMLVPRPETYRVAFTMGAASDPHARLVFDLGQSAAAVTISSVVVEELE
jgi:aryl-phospho-beta-D-glucosidase BglC (GH1 family)